MWRRSRKRLESVGSVSLTELSMYEERKEDTLSAWRVWRPGGLLLIAEQLNERGV